MERFHQTLRRELLDEAGVFPDLAAAQEAVDGFLHEYNTNRPHQSLDMAFPADRFRPNRPTPAGEVAERGGEALLAVKLPKFLTDTLRADPAAAQPLDGLLPELGEPSPAKAAGAAGLPLEPARWDGGPVEFDRVVPPSGNLQVCGKQFWLGPVRSGLTVTFWADTDVIHLLIGGARIKSVRSHLSVTHLAQLARDGGRPAGPPPIPVLPFTGPVEVDRTVSNAGAVSLGQHIVLAAEILRGRRVVVRIEEHTLLFFDPDTRELLRTRPNPLTPAEVARLRSARPAGPPPQPSTGPVRVERRASNTGTVMVAGQKIALGRVHAGKTVAITVTDAELVVECDDGHRAFRRTTQQPVRSIKAHRPRKADLTTPTTTPAAR